MNILVLPKMSLAEVEGFKYLRRAQLDEVGCFVALTIHGHRYTAEESEKTYEGLVVQSEAHSRRPPYA